MARSKGEGSIYYIEKRKKWSAQYTITVGGKQVRKTVYGNTKRAVEMLANQLKEKGYEKVIVTDLARCDMAEAVEDAFRHDKLVLASSTYDGGLFPCMEDFLLHLKAKNYQKRTVALMENGSWAPQAARKMREILEGMKNVEICEPVVTIKSTMKDETLKVMEELAGKLV